jgi:ankyrin repeat protein
VKDVVEDCCGSCPRPTTDEEIEVAEKESKRYVSGKMDFIVDDPGRQEIGSFNPLTEQDWTDMAYVGNTARLCQSIVDGDLDEVKAWLSQDGVDVNQRDHTGRTPLQLAIVSSTPEIVQCLVDSGARMISRLADGRTALHLAASRGSSEIIKILMERSLQNEQAEEERKDKKATTRKNGTPIAKDADESDIELVDEPDSDDDESMATASFVKIRNDEDEHKDLDGSAEDPDIFNIDVLAWDVPCSPLHLAIVAGHEDAVKMLCDYSADSILPVKFFDRYNNEQSTALLTLTLALTLPSAKAKSMAQLLCTLGATSSQAESNGTTAFHRYVASGQRDMVDTLLESDRSGVKRAINHLVITGSSWSSVTISALHTAIEQGDSILTLKLLNMGAQPTIKFETWLKSAKFSPAMADSLGDLGGSKNSFRSKVHQPLLCAIYNGHPTIAMQLLESGANPNTLTAETEGLLIHEHRRPHSTGNSALDVVDNLLDQINKKLQTKNFFKKSAEPPKGPKNTDACLSKYTPGTYQHWVVSEQIKTRKKQFLKKMEEYEKNIAQAGSEKNDTKEDALRDIKLAYENLRDLLKSKGAKPFAELHPGVKGPERVRGYRPNRYSPSEEEEKDFDWEFCFYGDQDITDARKAGYLNL